MPIGEKRTFSKTLSFTFQENEQLNEIVEKLGALSPSEVVRSLVREKHVKEFPDYIYKRSATDMLKRRNIEVRVDLENMSEIEFAEEYIPGGIYFKNDDGGEWYLIFGFNDKIQPVNLVGIKEWYKRNTIAVDTHKQEAKTKDITSVFDENVVKYLQMYYLLNVPVGYGQVTEGEEESQSN